MILLGLVLIALTVQDPRPQPRDPARRPSASTAPAASISGRVTDADSGRPLSDVFVTALSPIPGNDGEWHHYKAFTDTAGRYTLSELPPGDYMLTAWPGDYRATHRPATFGGYSSGPGATAHSPPNRGIGRSVAHRDRLRLVPRLRDRGTGRQRRR